MTKVELQARLGVLLSTCTDTKNPSKLTKLSKAMKKLDIAKIEMRPGSGFVGITHNGGKRFKLSVEDWPKEESEDEK